MESLQSPAIKQVLARDIGPAQPGFLDSFESGFNPQRGREDKVPTQTFESLVSQV